MSLLLLVAASSAFAQWDVKPQISQARTYPMTAASGDKLFFFGGSLQTLLGPTGVPTAPSNNAWVLNVPGGNTWTNLSAMPTARAAGYASYINGKVYIVAGVASFSNFPAWAANTLEYDPATNKYTTRAAIPTPVFGAACATIGNKIYVIGGVAGDPTAQTYSFPKSVQIYDQSTNTWSVSSNNFPYSPIYASATAVGSDIYVVGGADAGSGFGVTSNAYKGTVSPNGIVWSRVNDYPIKVAGLAGGSLNGKPYFAGGQDAAGTPIRNSYYFSTISNGWETGYGLPTAEANVSTLAYDGTYIYYAGGSGGSRATYALKEGPAVAVAEVNPINLYVTLKKGADPQDMTVNVANWGIKGMNGGVSIPSQDQSWIQASQSSFNSLAPGTSTNITLSVGDANKAEGNYKSVVSITTDDPAHASIPVNVYLYIRQELNSSPTKVLVEESSGAWCGPCGAIGVPTLRTLQAKYGEDLLIIALHDRGGRGATADTLATTETEGLGQLLGVPFFPAASINRYSWQVPSNTGQMIGTSDWDGAIGTVLQQVPTSPITLKFKDYSYNAATQTVTATLLLRSGQAFPLGANVSPSLHVTGVCIEDSIRYDQYQGPESPFYHMHAARSFWPNTSGQALVDLPDSVQQDNVLLPNVDAAIPVSFHITKLARASKCNVVFFAHVNYGSVLGPVLQAIELPLTSSISSNGTTSFGISTTTSTKSVTAPDSAKFTTTVNNTGTNPIEITIERTADNFPSTTWTTWFCVDGSCTQPSESSMGPITIAPGQSKTVTIGVFGPTNGTGTVTLRYSGNNNAHEDQTYTATVTGNAGVDLVTTGANGMRLMQNTPNPATSVTTFPFELPSTAGVLVEVFNMAGEKVYGVDLGRVEAGSHSFDLNVAALTSGVYSVRVNANGSTLSRMMNVTR